MADITTGQDVDIISPIGQKVMASSVSVVLASDQASTPNAGDVAHDAGDSGNPVKIGGRANSAATFTNFVTDGDRVNAAFDRYGRQLVAFTDPAQQKSFNQSYTTTQTGANMCSPTSGNRICIEKLHITTGSTTAGVVTIWGAPTGTTAYTANTDQTFFRGEFAPSATVRPGAIIPGPFYSDTTDDCIKITTSAGMTLYVQVFYHEFDPA